MKITFTYTIDVLPHHYRMLRMLKERRLGWRDDVIGRTLDDLSGWGLVEQSRVGCELYSITHKGLEALKQYEEKKTLGLE